jgi:hypothetical protein
VNTVRLLDLDVTLFYGSLGIALAAVVVFLWLVRKGRGAGPRS